MEALLKTYGEYEKGIVWSMEELKGIMEKFAASSWDLIAKPAQAWLDGKEDHPALVAAIKQAEKECGSCGCELDPLYPRALELL